MPDPAPRAWLDAVRSWQIERLAASLLLSGLVATAAISELTRRFGVAQYARQERGLLTQVSDAIDARLQVNAAALASVVALFQASTTVTRGEFGRFYATLTIPSSGRDAIGGLQGLGFARLLTPAQLAPFEARISSEGFPDFRVTPPGPRATYSAIEFLEPANPVNRQALGFDMATTPILQRAMQTAGRTGSATLSGRVKLEQDQRPLADGHPGVVLFMPIEKNGDGLLGWAYAPMAVEDLFEGVLATVNQAELAGATVRIIDRTSGEPASLLFSTAKQGRDGWEKPTDAEETLELAGRRWGVQVSLGSGQGSRYGLSPTLWAVLICGASASLVAAMAAHLLAINQRTTREALAVSKEAARERALASTVFDASDQGIVVTDPEGRILMANNAFTQLTGYHLSEIQAQKADLLKSGLHGPEFYHELWQGVLQRGHWQGDLWNRVRSGEIRRHHLAISTVRDEALQPRYLVGFLQDITERHAAEEMVRHQALHDPLTGLANRAQLMQQLERDLGLAKRYGRSIGLLYLDLDGFKEVNDRYGHAVGDRVLQLVGQRLQDVLRQSDLLCRQGGDEFVVLVPDAGSLDELVTLASKLAEVCGSSLGDLGTGIALSASVGIARFPDHGNTIDALLVAADNAMYMAKRTPGEQVHLAEPRPHRSN
jgi:diguanylate cyclase (GGDEF)-like protein/PAS domain S-box-containing protein